MENVICLGIVILLIAGIVPLNACQYVNKTNGMDSSQSNLRSHSFCNNNFALTATGFTNSRGSNI